MCTLHTAVPRFAVKWRWPMELRFLVLVAGASVSASAGAHAGNRTAVGWTPLLPTFCTSFSTNDVPYYVIIHVDGKPYAVIPDTGSSNLVLASDVCDAKCKVSPMWPMPETQKGQTSRQFEIIFGTGGCISQDAQADINVGGLKLPNGTFGAIVTQQAGTDGFNLFPAPSDTQCYNSYAGIWGMAYRGQDAGPRKEQGTHIGTNPTNTTNGTTSPILDQLSEVGMPNAFALETCLRYPDPCGPRSQNTTWAPSRECDIGYTTGNLYLGGYRSASLQETMHYTPITDEVHYDVELLGVEVCGSKGCQRVNFPDKIGGKTEDACVCQTPDCAMPLGADEYCYFTVLDSGAGRIYMNTVRNTKALIDAMMAVEMVRFAENTSQTGTLAQSFYYNKTAAPNAVVDPAAQFKVYFPKEDGWPFGADVLMDALFHPTESGLVQWGVQADLAVISAFQSSKFPVLLGDALFQGRTIFFDRSRRLVGMAKVKEELCGQPLRHLSEIDILGANNLVTPGFGCRRGTGSGGGCPQVHRETLSEEFVI